MLSHRYANKLCLHWHKHAKYFSVLNGVKIEITHSIASSPVHWRLVYYMYLQYLDTVGWVFWPVKTVSHITYNRKKASVYHTVNGNCALFHTSKTAKMIKVILLRAPCQNVNVLLINITFYHLCCFRCVKQCTIAVNSVINWSFFLLYLLFFYNSAILSILKVEWQCVISSE